MRSDFRLNINVKVLQPGVLHNKVLGIREKFLGLQGSENIVNTTLTVVINEIHFTRFDTVFTLS